MRAASLLVSMVAGRSREGAWIEIPQHRKRILELSVAPARERGLKLMHRQEQFERDLSLPRGSVD